MKRKSYTYLILLLFFTIALDKSVGMIYNQLYFTKKSAKNDRLIHSAIGTNEEILIFGSSRAYHHYDPKIFEDSLKMSCYNVGYGGQNIYFHLALLKSALSRYTPKIVILELFYIDFEKTLPQHDKEKLSTLLPFTKKSPVYYDAVLSRGWNERFKIWSSIYPLNSKQLLMLRNNYFDTITSNYKGFAKLNRTWDKPIGTTDLKAGIVIDNNKLDALFEFIEICQRNNIEVFVFVSPIYHIKENDYYSQVLGVLQSRYSITAMSFEDDSTLVNNRDFFADIVHLNALGSEAYSRKIVNFIKHVE